MYVIVVETNHSLDRNNCFRLANLIVFKTSICRSRTSNSTNKKTYEEFNFQNFRRSRRQRDSYYQYVVFHRVPWSIFRGKHFFLRGKNQGNKLARSKYKCHTQWQIPLRIVYFTGIWGITKHRAKLCPCFKRVRPFEDLLQIPFFSS